MIGFLLLIGTAGAYEQGIIGTMQFIIQGAIFLYMMKLELEKMERGNK